MAEYILQNSVLVVAHPDDEILWFPSVLEKVGQIIFCYIDYPSNPQWGIDRRQVIAEYPLSNLISLDMTESEVFNKMDWNKPEIGNYGVKINCKSRSALFYEKNFYRLLEILSETLKGFEQVITHNPWGEYGHEEHVQVYRAVKMLQSKFGYDIWFSNYFSNKSFNLLSRYLTYLSSECIKSRTNKVLTKSIKAIYEKNQCWTWYKDWEWLDEEILIKDKNTDSKEEIFNHTLPMHFIKVRPQGKRNKKQVFDKILRLKNKLIQMVR